MNSAASEAPRARRRVEALDRDHIGHPEARESVTHIAFADEAPQVGQLRRQRLDRLALARDGIDEVVGQDRAGDLHLDRPREGPLRHAFARARRDRKYRVITGATGVKQVGGAEVGLKARYREAVRSAGLAGFEIAGGVERQQHRNGTASDPGKNKRRDRVELHQRRHRARIPARCPPLAGKGEGGRNRRLGIDLQAELILHRAPLDPDGRDRRGAELVSRSASGGEKQTEGSQPTREQANSLRSQCIAPWRVPVVPGA